MPAKQKSINQPKVIEQPALNFAGRSSRRKFDPNEAAIDHQSIYRYFGNLNAHGCFVLVLFAFTLKKGKEWELTCWLSSHRRHRPQGGTSRDFSLAASLLFRSRRLGSTWTGKNIRYEAFLRLENSLVLLAHERYVEGFAYGAVLSVQYSTFFSLLYTYYVTFTILCLGCPFKLNGAL